MLGDSLCGLRVDIEQHQHEFLTAGAGEEVAWPVDCGVQQLVDAAQAIVTGCEVVTVVELFEAADIEDRRRSWSATVLRPLPLAFQRVLPESPITEATTGPHVATVLGERDSPPCGHRRRSAEAHRNPRPRRTHLDACARPNPRSPSGRMAPPVEQLLDPRTSNKNVALPS